MSVTAKIIGFGGVAAIAQVAVSIATAVVTAEVPPVEITHLAWNGHAVEFHRTVHAKTTIRASVQNEVVEVMTEQTVPGCLVAPPRRADFSPTESREKLFTLSQFVSPECEAALEAGRRYAMISVVVPLGGGDPTALRSEPFTWTGGGFEP